MKSHILSRTVFLTIAALALFTGCVSEHDQSEFPLITRQPEDQLVHMGSTAIFSVEAKNGPLAYQWLRNGNAILNQTNSILKIENAQIEDVGHYSCNVFKELEFVPTRSASLMVYTNYVPAGTDMDPVVVYCAPVASGGQQSVCPISYIGYVSYTKTVAEGWGWAPATNTTVHTATDTNRTDTMVYYRGKNNDEGCGLTSVTIPHPPVSAKYRFIIYFTNNVPTNAYSIVLDGFNP